MVSSTSTYMSELAESIALKASKEYRTPSYGRMLATLEGAGVATVRGATDVGAAIVEDAFDSDANLTVAELHSFPKDLAQRNDLDDTARAYILQVVLALKRKPPGARLPKILAKLMIRSVVREPFRPNKSVSAAMIAAATEWCAAHPQWEFELHDVGAVKIMRWVATAEIELVHLQDLVWFYESQPELLLRTCVVHAGRHWTDQGAIGEADPEFTAQDAAFIAQAQLTAAVQEFNATDKYPRYAWKVDYIDAGSFSKRFPAVVPSGQAV